MSEAARLLALAETMVTGKECDAIERQSLAMYISRVPYLQEVLSDIEEKNRDILVGMFWKKVRAGSTPELIFGLKCLCKDRGFIESPQGALAWQQGPYRKPDGSAKQDAAGSAGSFDISRLSRESQDKLGAILLELEPD